MDTNDLFTPKQKHRKEDPETSKEAAYRVDLNNGQNFILKAVAATEQTGATLKEICVLHNLQQPSYSSRCKELETMDEIFYKGDKREGGRIMRLKEYDTKTKVCGKCNGVLLGVYNFECHNTNCQ